MPDSKTKVCQNCKSDFIIDASDFLFYEKIYVPAPTWCPECRNIRRWTWRNERTFYKQACVLCGKSIISVFSRASGLTVYCSPCWWSDKWDGMKYGRDYDHSRPFLKQLHELFLKVPVMNTFGLYTTLINSEYTSSVGHLKNCYLLTHADNNENCSYGSIIDNSKDSIDNLMLYKCELMYGSVNCRMCYRTFFSVDCNDSHDIYFSKNCIGCNDCFGCINSRNKQYHIFNKPYSKEDYYKFLKENLPNSFSKLEKLKGEAEDHWLKYPNKYIHERHNSNITGDYIYNSKNTFGSFITADAENCKFISHITPGGIKDSYDFSHYGTTSELIYETLQAGDKSARIFLSWWIVTNSYNVEYSMFIIGGNNIFGSVGLRKKEYCILNKQYTKEEYEKLRIKIINDMNQNPYIDKVGRIYKYGEFFPTELSPFGYNETTAHETFPLTKEDTINKGYSWHEQEPRNYQITFKSEQIPDYINEIEDSILKEIIECQHHGACNENCTEAFRIIPQELNFLRKQELSLPRLCPNCRHYQRIKQRNPLKLWHRVCQCAGIKSKNGVYQNTTTHRHAQNHCPEKFETSYAPERPEIVYCEECYRQEVI